MGIEGGSTTANQWWVPSGLILKLINTTQSDSILVNESDRNRHRRRQPLHTGGFTLNARFYGFDLSAAFNWSYGNDIYNANKVEYTSTSKYHSRNMIS